MDQTLLPAKHKAHLARRDAILKPVIRKIGPCTLRLSDDHFATLVRSIVSQQISTKAAIAISNRLLEKVKRLQPRRLLAATDDDLRSAGLSRGKQRSIRDLAEKCQNGDVPLKKLSAMNDADVDRGRRRRGARHRSVDGGHVPDLLARPARRAARRRLRAACRRAKTLHLEGVAEEVMCCTS